MSIAIIVPSLRKKGPVIVATNLANEFVRKNINVNFFYLFSSKCEVEIDGNVCVYKLNIFNLTRLLTSSIVHSHGFVPDMINLIISKIRFWDKGLKSYSTVHNFLDLDFVVDYSKYKASLIGFLWPLIISRLNVVFISKSQEKYLLENYTFNKKHKVIYNPVYIKLKKELRLKNNLKGKIDKLRGENKIIIGTCSVLTARKSIDTVIKALSLLPDNYFLIIIGDGVEYSNLKKLTLELDLKDRVLFTGFLSEPLKMVSFFDVYIFPSIVEGFGLSGIEASMLNKPIICSNIETFKEIYDKSSTLYFTVGDHVDLKDKVLNSTDLSVNKGYYNKFLPKVISSEYLSFFYEKK